MSETYGKYTEEYGESSVTTTSTSVENNQDEEKKEYVLKQEVTVEDITNKNNISKFFKAKIELAEKKKQKMEESVLDFVSQLERKGIDINQWREKQSSDVEKAMNGESLVDMFLYLNKDKLLDCSTIDEIEEQFKIWNTERDKNLPSLLTDENLKAISVFEQIRRGLSTGANEDEVLKKSKGFLKRFAIGGKFKSDVESIFSQYSLGEIIGKVLETENFNGKKNQGFRKLQYLAGCYSKEDNSFSVTWDGYWGDQTGTFLTTLKNSEEFKSLPNADKYLAKIDYILKTHDPVHLKDNLYDQYGEVTNQRQEYLADPISYWKNQSVLSRHFVGVEESKTAYPSVDNMSKNDSDFIKGNRNGKLDGELADLFDARGKSEKEQKAINERLQALMPKEDMKGFLTKFLKNENIRKEFETMFNMPSTVLDDPILIETVVNGGEKTENTGIRDWIVSGMWASANNDLVGLSIDLQSYIRKQCGLSALQVRTKFLEDILGDGTELETLERESIFDPSDQEYTVYFKDKNCPSTTYEYRPNSGEIFAEKAYDSNDSQLSFGKGTKGKRLIHKMNANYSDFMQQISVENLLPNERCDTREELKDKIAKKIDSHMNYTAEYADLSVLKSENESVRLRNGIINEALDIFGYIDSGKGDLIDKGISLDKNTDGPYYHFMSLLINAVEGESEENLKVLSDFLSQLRNKINNIGSIDLKKEAPLMRFILSGVGQLKSHGDIKVNESDIKKEWKVKDLVLGTVLESLYLENGKFDYEKIRILNEGVNNPKYLELASSIESSYNTKAEKYDIDSVVSQTKGVLSEINTNVNYESKLHEALESVGA